MDVGDFLNGVQHQHALQSLGVHIQFRGKGSVGHPGGIGQGFLGNGNGVRRFSGFVSLSSRVFRGSHRHIRHKQGVIRRGCGFFSGSRFAARRRGCSTATASHHAHQQNKRQQQRQKGHLLHGICLLCSIMVFPESIIGKIAPKRNGQIRRIYGLFRDLDRMPIDRKPLCVVESP